MSSEHPPSQELPKQRSSCSTAALAFVALAGIATMLIMIPGFIGVGVVLVGLGFIGLLSFHYIVWGWWLSRELRSDDQPEDEAGP